MSSYLEISNLSQNFAFNNETTEVFSNLNLSLDKGEFLCILGPSGCGKTTFLRSLAGFIKPSSGQIHIDGNLVQNPGRHCAMVFQTFDQLLPWKTVLKNVTYPILVKKADNITKEQAKETATNYLRMVGLGEYINYYPHQLSGGMKQRVAIARALAMQPSLILMDEPFASVDADTRLTLQRGLLKAWMESGATVLFVTHSIIEAISLSTKIMVMGEGGTKLFIDNFVEGERGKLRNPQSPNYNECWSLLANAVKREEVSG